MRIANICRGLAMIGVPLAAAAATGIGLSAPASAAESSMVSVVHGIPGQPVDVYVNGEKTLDAFAPATVAGPLSLPSGTYDVAVTKPGDPVTSAILEDKAVAVPGGKNLSLVAHLDTGGNPALTAFVNDTSPIKAGMSRLVVRHTAQAPAVDVRAEGEPVFSNLTNPDEATADVPAGTVSADVVLAGTSTVVLGPQSLNLGAGTSTIVYAIGSADAKSLALVAQTITGLGAGPAGMPAGTGGQAGTGVAGWWYAVAGAGLALMAGGSAVAVRRSSGALRLGGTLRLGVVRRLGGTLRSGTTSDSGHAV